MNSPSPNSNLPRLLIIILILVAIVAIGVSFLNRPDHRSTGQRIGDSVSSLSNGNGISNSLDRARDRSPAQKIGDDLHDTGKKIDNDLKDQ